MTTTPDTTPAPLIYAGSMEKYHGAAVLELKACLCRECAHTAEPARITAAVELDGREFKLHHARAASFVPAIPTP